MENNYHFLASQHVSSTAGRWSLMRHGEKNSSRRVIMTEVHFSKCCLTFSPRNSWSGKRSMNFVYLQNISAVAESLRNIFCLVSMMRGVRRFWLGLKIFSMKAVKWILRRIFMKCCSTPRFTTWIDFFNFFSFSDNVVCRPTHGNICELSPWSRWLVLEDRTASRSHSKHSGDGWMAAMSEKWRHGNFDDNVGEKCGNDDLEVEQRHCSLSEEKPFCYTNVKESSI